MNFKQRAKDAVASGDAKALWELMEEAMANDERRHAEEVARREAQMETFRAEARPVSRLKVIALKARKGGVLYVTKVSYKPGDGFAVAKIAYGPDKTKAMEFSTIAAEKVSEYLIRCGYRPHLDSK